MLTHSAQLPAFNLPIDQAPEGRRIAELSQKLGNSKTWASKLAEGAGRPVGVVALVATIRGHRMSSGMGWEISVQSLNRRTGKMNDTWRSETANQDTVSSQREFHHPSWGFAR